MRNLKITKIVLSLILMLGLTTSSFAMGHGGKAPKHHKQDVKIVKVYKEPHHHHHHYKHHDKVVYHSYNNSNDVAAIAIGTGLCLAVIAAINS
ncbi:MAG: hypothetical protein K5622_04645 [Endomicrobiaceae bacterium]|nr:hypothetical protein [Endomicrobiaceae bacterium]